MAAQEYIRIIFSEYDQDIRQMRVHLRLDLTGAEPSGVCGNVNLNESDVGEPTRKTEGGLFHLILILRLIDITMFYEANASGGNPVKIPKSLTWKTSTELLASKRNCVYFRHYSSLLVLRQTLRPTKVAVKCVKYVNSF